MTIRPGQTIVRDIWLAPNEVFTEILTPEETWDALQDGRFRGFARYGDGEYDAMLLRSCRWEPKPSRKLLELLLLPFADPTTLTAHVLREAHWRKDNRYQAVNRLFLTDDPIPLCHGTVGPAALIKYALERDLMGRMLDDLASERSLVLVGAPAEWLPKTILPIQASIPTPESGILASSQELARTIQARASKWEDPLILCCCGLAGTVLPALLPDHRCWDLGTLFDVLLFPDRPKMNQWHENFWIRLPDLLHSLRSQLLSRPPSRRGGQLL